MDILPFWDEYAAAEQHWIAPKPQMDESDWADDASEVLYDFSSLGTAPFDVATTEGYSGRPVFRYRQYEHPSHGEVFRLFTTSDQPCDDLAGRQFLVTSKGGLHILAEFMTCLTCRGTGALSEGTCSVCAGKGALPRSAAGFGSFNVLGTRIADIVVDGVDPHLGDPADW